MFPTESARAGAGPQIFAKLTKNAMQKMIFTFIGIIIRLIVYGFKAVFAACGTSFRRVFSFNQEQRRQVP